MDLSRRTGQTICAVSTPPGYGGLSVVRVSGPRSVEIVRQIAPFLPEQLESHRVYYGILRSNIGEIDEVLITFFKQGRSFTGEDVLEISCHGNPNICRAIIDSLVSSGASTALPGEFTLRAFMNGRLDLTRAEAVLDLIQGQSERSRKLALRQLQGHISEVIEEIESNITLALAHLEANIDFSTEGVEPVSSADLSRKIEQILVALDRILQNYSQGRLIKDGIRVVVVGPPNAGKSSLVNLLVQEERSIVTPIPGTTRDTIEGETAFRGQKFIFVDTAGIRDTVDPVEAIGVARARAAMANADLVLGVFDLSKPERHEEFLSSLVQISTPILYLGNKLDLCDPDRIEKFPLPVMNRDSEKIFISALDPESRPRILEKIMDFFHIDQVEDSAVISNSRHYECLSMARECLMRSKELLDGSASPELPALELKEALLFIQQVLGKRFDDDILDRVFKEFCIGK
ncbi:MAG: tRNA uridine-5-carboxymethylaminomethyl(34) synthesis GTPase MnmE [Bdellovibrionaceae bacterium]|nr:tRNA uridine-5-carboxymethylaminomethyl(34) synthesis GTPase MnmE [Pseudobdellovibrionaceae bacterium]